MTPHRPANQSLNVRPRYWASCPVRMVVPTPRRWPASPRTGAGSRPPSGSFAPSWGAPSSTRACRSSPTRRSSGPETPDPSRRNCGSSPRRAHSGRCWAPSVTPRSWSVPPSRSSRSPSDSPRSWVWRPSRRPRPGWSSTSCCGCPPHGTCIPTSSGPTPSTRSRGAPTCVGVAQPDRQPTAGRAGRRRAGRSGHVPDEGRRSFLRGAAVAAGALLIGAVSRTAAGSRPVRAAESLPGGSGGGATTRPRRHPHRSGQSPPAGTPIATLDSIPVGGAISFQDPNAGPAILVRTASSDVAAFSRVCTHAGCLVGYDQASELIVCPCHGAEFDPKQRAAVVAGPAPTPLAPISVAIDPSTGQVLRQD